MEKQNVCGGSESESVGGERHTQRGRERSRARGKSVCVYKDLHKIV